MTLLLGFRLLINEAYYTIGWCTSKYSWRKIQRDASGIFDNLV